MEAAEGDVFIVRVIRKLGDVNPSGGLSSFYIVLFILQVLMQLIIPFFFFLMHHDILAIRLLGVERKWRRKTSKQVDWRAWPPRI